MSFRSLITFLLALLIVAGCVPVIPDSTPETVLQAPIAVNQIALSEDGVMCSGRFVAHDLDHTTTVPGGDTVRQFEANGSGVAINDLDNDGDLDIVLANHAAANTILWNEENLRFRTQHLIHSEDRGDSRAATIVDVDGDGWQDIVFTRTRSAPTYWHNQGNGRFVREILPGVSKPLYTINWGDLDGDGDLDFVGGTYDAGLLAEFGQEFLSGNDAGVYYYENIDGSFHAQRLALNAQALALALVDLNDDARLDILVGNDFGVPDYAWLREANGWQALVLPVMSHSTMSYDAGDIDNDGRIDVFSTDMKPYPDEPMAPWQPVMAGMMDDPHIANDPQIMANVLRVQGQDKLGTDKAVARGIDATGWSWSGKFGDLDQDGFLDLYVVNGMIEATAFAHLPNHELVEENQALRNDGRGYFALAPEWQLNATRSGRGMSMADLDGDGDLDIVVNNLRGAAQLFENQLCKGTSLQVDLRWPGSGNTRAVGAVLILYTDMGTLQRQVKAASGYLSGDATRVHFGIPTTAKLKRLDIHWPDHVISQITHVHPSSRSLFSVEATKTHPR